MNIQPAASSDIWPSLPWCGECQDERPRTVTITRSDGSEVAALCSPCITHVLSSLLLCGICRRKTSQLLSGIRIGGVATATSTPMACLRVCRAGARQDTPTEDESTVGESPLWW
jgi:ferredoxin